MVIKNKELANGEGEYDLGIHLQIQGGGNPKVVIRNQYFKHIPPKQCWSGKKVQMTEQAQVLHLC